MGRSVSVPSDAVGVFYLDYAYEVTDEDLNESIDINEAGELCRHDREAWRQAMESDQFDDLLEDLQVNVFGQFPSVSEADRWLDNEDHVIAENELVAFGISEYCGLASVWVVVKEQDGWYGQAPVRTGLAYHWISQAWPKVEAMFPSRLGLMGRFSNGEAVYQREEKG